MQLGKIYTAQADVTNPNIITIEVDITNRGIPAFTIVGMADKAIDESRERINAALKNCGLTQPKQKKTIVSLSPADIRKNGPLFDLPIALGVLLADEENDISFSTETKLFVGELSLDGSVKSVNGALSIASAAKEHGFKSLYLPKENAKEASLIDGISVFPVTHIHELLEHLAQEGAETIDISKCIKPVMFDRKIIHKRETTDDFAYIVEQTLVKRALEIAAAGGHNIALYGPAGTGKTMLAKAFCTILPDLSRNEQVATTMIHSYAGVLKESIITTPPLRAPHHTSSYVAVIGGGTYPKPGEVTLAHNGVLFLDEFPEFDKRVLESLREPLEEQQVRISRSSASVCFPANFILIAAMNPPSAVYRSNALITQSDERAFKRKLSGPMMDRIDMWIEVPKIDHRKLLTQDSSAEKSCTIQKRVLASRKIQQERFGSEMTNARMKPQEIIDFCFISEEAKEVLNSASEKLHLSPRVYHKVIKLGRTIADLDHSHGITEAHILEALQYRPKDII